jgi:hypothetical protein
MIKKLLVILMLCLPVFQATSSAQVAETIAMAYVKDNSVWLADLAGTPIYDVGPPIEPTQGAVLFWSPDGTLLYTATRSGLFVTSADGGASSRLPGEFGLTVTFARHGGVIYNLDVENPQEIEENIIGFPLRQTNIANLEGGRGQMIATIGEYDASSAAVYASHAAALYARDAGLLGAGRPHIWATYGGSLFYSCCFPAPGLNVLELSTGEASIYDATILPGPAALNGTSSRLAAPTTEGFIRVIDLISAGTRDYLLQIPYAPEDIERMVWGTDDSTIFFTIRAIPQNALDVLPIIEYAADTRSAFVELWKLDLVTGRFEIVTDFGDVFGVSSIAANRDYIFVTVVERNEALIQALNTGVLPANISPTDPALNDYIPRTLLWRIDRETGEKYALSENTWGVVSRPR